MPKPKTHREVKHPQISARYLADYMAASEQARRTIVRDCKYRAIARLIQHDEAKLTISSFLRDEKISLELLHNKVNELRSRMAESDFEKDLYDHNASYIERFTEVCDSINFPKADFEAPGQSAPLTLHGTKITVDISFRLRRTTRTNKGKVGAASLRYMKNKALSEVVAQWQSAFMFGYLNAIGVDEGADVDPTLCLTIDAFGGFAYPAPSDAVSRFKNLVAACASIAERWPNIAPPKGAVF